MKVLLIIIGVVVLVIAGSVVAISFRYAMTVARGEKNGRG